MFKYKVRFIKSCKKLLDDLEIYNPHLFKKISKMIDEILEDPFRSKFKKLKDRDNYRRNRYGNYRVVYFVIESTVYISRIELRKNVYKIKTGCPKLSKKKLKSIH